MARGDQAGRLISLRAIVDERGISPAQLAAEAGISEVRLHALLGGADATMDELSRIAARLSMRVSDFMEPESLGVSFTAFRESEAGSHRKPASRTLVARRVEACLAVLSQADVALPPWTPLAEGPFNSLDDAERAAGHVRSALGYDDTAPISLPHDAERLGLYVWVAAVPGIEGASAVLRQHAFAIVAPRFGPRMQFTLAHELGHLVAEPHEGLFVDAEIREDQVGTPSRLSREGFANAFASALLLPRRGVGMLLGEVRRRLSISADAVGDVEILLLSYHFGVSFETAAFRCEALGVLPRGGATSLYQELKRLHKSPEGRARDVGLPERPLIAFPRIPEGSRTPVLRAINDGRLSVGAVAGALGVPISDIFAWNEPRVDNT